MSFLCPFCGRLMDQVNDAVFICKPCDFLVNFKRKQGVIGNKAPHHLNESNLFLSQFYDYKPDYVLTKYPLWSKDFDRKDVVFFGDTFECDHLTDGGDYKGESSVLLAGKGYIADFLVDYFVQGLLMGSEDNPLDDFTNKPSVEKYLFSKFVLKNMPKKIPDARTIDTVFAYFAPSVDGQLQAFFNTLNDKVSTLPTDNAVLYTLIFSDYFKKDLYSGQPSTMATNIVNRLMSYLESVPKFEDIIYEKPTSVVTSYVREVILMGTINGYVNRTNGSLPTYDINLKEQVEFPDSVTSKLICKYKLKSRIIKCNCESYVDGYGIESKKAFLDRYNVSYDYDNTDEILIKFYEFCSAYYS